MVHLPVYRYVGDILSLIACLNFSHICGKPKFKEMKAFRLAFYYKLCKHFISIFGRLCKCELKFDAGFGA